MLFLLAIVLIGCFVISDVRTGIRRWRWERNATPEMKAERARNLQRIPRYHLVPYAVEWGVTSYRKCYCDGSVCGTIPRGSTVQPSRPDIPTVTTPQAGEFTPQNVIDAVAEVAQDHLWLPKRPSQSQ
jgi:hypothetical protein